MCVFASHLHTVCLLGAVGEDESKESKQKENGIYMRTFLIIHQTYLYYMIRAKVSKQTCTTVKCFFNQTTKS